MTAPAELTRRVCAVTGAITALLAVTCGLLRGPADALGVLVGSALTLMNFVGLSWAVTRATTSGHLLEGRRRVIWVGASGLRLGLLGVLAGVAVTVGEVGLAGLLVALTLLPVAVLLAGLAAARVS
jgi:hypothetical protein